MQRPSGQIVNESLKEIELFACIVKMKLFVNKDLFGFN